MIFWFLDLLPTAFGYVSTRMVLAALTTLILTILPGAWFIRKLYELKIGQSIRVEHCPTLAKLHQDKQMTPTMGGVLMLFGVLISSMLWMDLSQSYTWVLVVTCLWMGAIGAYDDYLKLKYRHPKGLPGRWKMALQIVLGIGVAIFVFKSGSVEYFLPFKKHAIFTLSGLGVYLISAFVIVGSSNGVNLTDGLDGLAAGTILPVALVLSVFAFVSGNGEIARYLNLGYIERAGEIGVFLCAMAGASLGFLWYNGHPAQVFMGDTGSLSMGALLGLSAVLLRREGVLAIVGAVFVAETLSVILQVGSYKLRKKKRLFLCTPLHHHFEYKGWPENRVVVRFWIVGFLLAAVAVASIKFQ